MRPGSTAQQGHHLLKRKSSSSKAGIVVTNEAANAPFNTNGTAIVYEVEHPENPGVKVMYEVCCNQKKQGRSGRNTGAFCGLKPVKSHSTTLAVNESTSCSSIQQQQLR